MTGQGELPELPVPLIGLRAWHEPCFARSCRRTCPALDEAPWPGELGKRIYDNVSAQAWKMWEDRMKMILNEYRLMPWQKEAQQLMAKQMEEFFFSGTDALPPEYKPK